MKKKVEEKKGKRKEMKRQIKNIKLKKRREGDLNPRVAKQHRISNPTPYRARLSRHLDTFLLIEKRIFNHYRPFDFLQFSFVLSPLKL